MTDITENEDELQLYSSGSGMGNVLINPDVIARIAGMAVSEVEGVSLGTKFSIADILPNKEPVRGIHVVQNESGRYSITCEVKMAYRTPMRETAERVQRHVKETVERMSSLDLETVDVRIVDIYVEKDRQEREKEKERGEKEPLELEEETKEEEHAEDKGER